MAAMTLDQALADVVRFRRVLLDATRHRPRAEQQAVSDGEIGVRYRRAVTRAQQVWLDEEWARGCQARSADLQRSVGR